MGQADPDNIQNFCKDGRRKLIAESKRVLLICYTCRLNTAHSDYKFVSLSNKLMDNVESKGIEMGVTVESDVPEIISIPSTYIRKRKRWRLKTKSTKII